MPIPEIPRNPQNSLLTRIQSNRRKKGGLKCPPAVSRSPTYLVEGEKEEQLPPRCLSPCRFSTVPVVEEPKPKTKTSSKSEAAIMQKCANMISGIREHAETLTTVGLTPETVTALEGIIAEYHTKNGEQEIMKGKLKEKTAEVNGQVKLLREQLKQCSKIIKVFIQQERWVDFGIGAKK